MSGMIHFCNVVLLLVTVFFLGCVAGCILERGLITGRWDLWP